MPAVDLWRDVPGYAEAARRENEIRTVPFLGQPERVAGVDCAPLTLRRVLWLQLIKSPFVYEVTAEQLKEKQGVENDIFVFLWVCSPEFKPGSERARRRCYRRIAKTILKADASFVLQEILDYMAEAWMDAGEGDRSKAFCCTAADITEFFAREFQMPADVWENGWLRNLWRKLTGQVNPLDMPLKIAWQLLRARRSAKNPNIVLGNKLSDPVVKDFLRDLNKNVKRMN